MMPSRCTVAHMPRPVGTSSGSRLRLLWRFFIVVLTLAESEETDQGKTSPLNLCGLSHFTPLINQFLKLATSYFSTFVSESHQTYSPSFHSVGFTNAKGLDMIILYVCNCVIIYIYIHGMTDKVLPHLCYPFICVHTIYLWCILRFHHLRSYIHLFVFTVHIDLPTSIFIYSISLHT